MSKKYCDTNNILTALQLILNRKIAKGLRLEAKKKKNWRSTKLLLIKPMSSSGYVYYFKACTILTKLCLGLSLKFKPISGVVSFLNRIIFSTTHMIIFLPHTRNGTITFGLSFDTNAWELLYLVTGRNEHDKVNVLPPPTLIHQSVKFYFYFVLKSQTLHIPPYGGRGGDKM